MRERIRQIIQQTCDEMGVHIVRGVLARDPVHMFRLSRRIQLEFLELRKRYRGRRFWARGYFSTTSGNVTDDTIMRYLELQSAK
jgi:putative transposase